MRKGMDIPAIKFRFTITNYDLNYDPNKDRMSSVPTCDFDQFDGLSVGQVVCLSGFWGEDCSIGLFATVNVGVNDKPLYVNAMSMFQEIYTSDWDMEISEYFEEELVKHLKKGDLISAERTYLHPKDIVSTFLARYRGKTPEMIEEILNKKEKER